MGDLIEYASQYVSGDELELFKLIVLIIFVVFGLQLLGWLFGRK